MKVLVTGAKGFVGKNLCAQLNNIKTGKVKCYGNLVIEEVFEYDLDSTPEQLDAWCKDCDFVFNLAGVNRPQDPKEFMEGNFGFATVLLNTLKKYKNNCPVMISSSIQATLAGRFGTSEYGKSKKVGEELLYIDDLVEEMICALNGEEHHCEFEGVETVLSPNGRYCTAPITHHVKLGEIVDLLYKFAEMPKTLMIPEIPAGSFAKRLYSTFLSYLPKEKVIFDLKMNVDNRGSFTELVHTINCGQVSINISKPGITKGEHWHHTKWELFIVVSGYGLIQLRNENDPNAEILEYEVSGDKIQSVIMLPGYTHNIINLSDTQDLVTVMYCNEIFNSERPDTFFDKVVIEREQ